MRYFFTLLFATLSLNAVGQVPSYVPTDGLVAWYPFNGNANDESENGNDGTVTGTILDIDRFNVPNSCYSFDGNDQIEVLNEFYNNGWEEYTFSIWFKTSSANQTMQTLFNTIPHDGEGLGWNHENALSKISHSKNLDTAYHLWDVLSVHPLENNDVEGNIWTHIVIAKQGLAYTYYINSGFDNEVTTSTAALQQFTGIRFGSIGSSEFLNGSLDDIGIWNRALSEEEILGLYNSQPLISGCTDTAACNFNENAVEDDGSCEYITPVDLGEDIITCDESVTLDAGEGYESYLWSNGETTQSIEVSESGDYSVEVGNGNNSSMSFDGVDDYVDVGSSDSLMIIGDLSISFNINLDILQTYYQDIVTYVTWGESLTTNALYAIEIPPNTNTLKYVHEYSSGSNEEVVLNYNLNPDQWYSITIIRDSQNKEIYFYVDNVLIQTSSYLYNPEGGTASSLTMGWSNNSPFVGEKFKGELDNVQIWNKILSQQEIQNYINCPPTGTEEGLVGYWNFEEGSGTTAFDQTENGNNGTINGATWSTETPEQSCSFCSSSDEIVVTINFCGCTDSEAVNYNLEANEDDSSCCYDIDYVNESNNQSYNDGYSDGVDSVICPENNCPADLTLDGIVSTADLLMFLISFGTICEVTDECGVINGDGSTCANQCGEPISHEGYNYSTVQIGEQCWFSENCRYLPEVSPSSEGSETDPHYYVYYYQGTDVESAKSTENYETYGVLYNWPAVMTDEICPSGWHIPSDGEWQTLEISLGMSESEASSIHWRGTDEGFKLKDTTGWEGDGNGSNLSGFSTMPGGYRNTGGGFFHNFSQSYFWSITTNGVQIWYRNLNSSNLNVYRKYDNLEIGMSARCIKD